MGFFLRSVFALIPAVLCFSSMGAAPLQVRTAVSADGIRIRYSVEGSSEAVPVVFIHGWSCDRSFWDAQAAALADRFQVVRLDLAGHGESEAGRKAWSMVAFGQDVAAVVKDLKASQVILVGHSMGGPVALEASRLMPGKVLGIVGVDTLQNVEQHFPEDLWNQLLQGFEADFGEACSGFVHSMFPPSTERKLVENVVTRMCDAPPEIAVALLRGIKDYDGARALAGAGTRVRCINADLYPTAVVANRRYLADFDAVIMSGVGHFLMLERPEEFNRHLARLLGDLSR